MLCSIAKTSQSQSEYNEALKLFQQAIKYDDSIAILWMNLALTYTDLKEYASAKLCFKQAHKLDESDPLIWYNRASLFIEEKNYDSAILNLKRAIRLQPLYIEAHTNLGNAYRRIGKMKEAEHEERIALALNPKSPATLLNLAQILAAKGENHEAVKYLLKALEIVPKNYFFNIETASRYLEIRDFKAANKYADIALDLDPNLSKAYIYKGLICAYQDDYVKAVEYFKEALDRDPNDKQAINNLAFALDKLGKKEEARKMMKKADSFVEKPIQVVLPLDNKFVFEPDK